MKNLFFWILSLLITLGVATYQYLTGPDYPIKGKAYFDQLEIPYKLPRSHATNSDCPLELVVPDENILAYVEYRRYDSEDLWTRSAFKRKGDIITSFISPLPSTDIIEYRIVLFDNDRNIEISIPQYGLIVMRWHRPVPAAFQILQMVTLFLGLCLALRTGLEAMSPNGKAWRLALMTALFLFLGGLLFASIVEKYSSGTWWTGFPIGNNLHANRMLFAFLCWLTVLSFRLRGEVAKGWYIAASLLTLAVFLIPYSVLTFEPRITYPLFPDWRGI